MLSTGVAGACAAFFLPDARHALLPETKPQQSLELVQSGTGQDLLLSREEDSANSTLNETDLR